MDIDRSGKESPCGYDLNSTSHSTAVHIDQAVYPVRSTIKTVAFFTIQLSSDEKLVIFISFNSPNYFSGGNPINLSPNYISPTVNIRR